MKRILVFFFILLSCLLRVQAQDTNPLTDKSTWGHYAEDHIRSLYGLCKLTNTTKKFTEKFNGRSVIPSALFETIRRPLDDKIIAKPGANISTIFDFIYDGTSAATNTNKSRLESASIANPSLVLLGDNFKFDNFGVESSPQNLVYRQTCAGTAIAAVGAKLDIPFANISSQINAENSTNGEFIVIKANRFKSPIKALLDSEQRPEKLSLFLRLWSRWLDSTSGLNTLNNPQYLTGFDGMLISHSAQLNSSYTIKGNAEAGYSLPVFSISGSGQAQYSKTTSVTMSSPDMLFTITKSGNDEQPTVFFEPVPAPSRIAEFAGEITPEPVGRTELTAGSTYSEVVNIKGIPEDICDRLLWSAQEITTGRRASGDEVLNLSLTGAEKMHDNKQGSPSTYVGCSFKVETSRPLDLASPLFAQNALHISYPLSYDIVYSKPYVKGATSTSVRFKVRANLNRQLDFFVTSIGAPSGDILGGAQASTGVQWAQSFRVIDVKNQIDDGKVPKISNVKANNCAFLDAQGEPTPGAFDSGLFKLTTNFKVKGTTKIGGLTGEQCFISFDIQIPKKGNSFTPVQTVTFQVASPVVPPAPEIQVVAPIVPTTTNPQPAAPNPSPKPPQ